MKTFKTNYKDPSYDQTNCLYFKSKLETLYFQASGRIFWRWSLFWTTMGSEIFELGSQLMYHYNQWCRNWEVQGATGPPTFGRSVIPISIIIFHLQASLIMVHKLWSPLWHNALYHSVQLIFMEVVLFCWLGSYRLLYTNALL